MCDHIQNTELLLDSRSKPVYQPQVGRPWTRIVVTYKLLEQANKRIRVFGLQLHQQFDIISLSIYFQLNATHDVRKRTSRQSTGILLMSIEGGET